jgi:hypothetical protein
MAGFLVPAHDAIVRDVAPQQAARVAEPDRAFIPAAAARDALDRGLRDSVFVERRIERLDRGIRISFGRLPRGERLRRDRGERDHGARGRKHLTSRLIHDVSPL